MKYLYYPGCSMRGAGRPYEESLRAVFQTLEIPLEEIDDWNCCGATAYMSVDETQAFALAARNLALAERQSGAGPRPAQPDFSVIAPCSACYMVLLKTQKYLQIYPDVRQAVESGLKEAGLSYSGAGQVRHPLDVLVNDVGLDRIRQHVKRPLKGLKVACYYGCQIVRPFETFDSCRNPQTMEKLVKALGGEPVAWPLKTRCCGGALTGTAHEVGVRLSYILLKEAEKRGADIIITTCPLCQLNLECYQREMNRLFRDPLKLPVAFFTQLMGMAFGLPDRDLGIQRLFIKPNTSLEEAEHAHA